MTVDLTTKLDTKQQTKGTCWTKGGFTSPEYEADGVHFITLLRMTCNLTYKIVYFCSFPFNIIRAQLTIGNWNHGNAYGRKASQRWDQGRLLYRVSPRGPNSASGTDTSPLAHGCSYIQSGTFRRNDDVLGKISPVPLCSLPRVLRMVIPHCHSGV